MKHHQEVKKLSAMAHDSRLSLLKFLISKGRDGAIAGDIAAHAGLAPSTASVQLTVLVNAALVDVQREGRNIRYRADFTAMRGLLTYLLEDCCGGNAELCEPLASVNAGSTC